VLDRLELAVAEIRQAPPGLPVPPEDPEHT
jgi:hypothetical protein